MWPFRPRTSIVASIVMLVLLMVAVVALRLWLDWPSTKSESTLLVGVFLINLPLILLSLANVIIERGGVIEVRSIES